MKATLEFQLPEEQSDLDYALAGTSALLTLEDLLQEIRAKLKYDSGEFQEWKAEIYNEETNSFEKKTVQGCAHTLERVRAVLFELKQNRRLPELI